MRKVSIIIPVYNTKNELRQCLDSVCNQTYQNLEIICIDDGSTDGSEKILDQYALKDSRFKVIHKKNGGESSARNVGIKEATGEYIGFLDCDDWIELNMYQVLVDNMKKYKVDLVAASWFKEEMDKSITVLNNGEVKQGVLDQGTLLYYIYARDRYQGFAYMWDKLYKRELLLKSNGEPLLFDENLKLGGDVLYLAEILLNVHNAVYINTPLYHYRQRANSGCHMIDLERRMDWLLAYKKVISIFENHNINEKVTELVKRFLVYHSCNTAQIAYQQGKENELQECKRIMRQYQREYEETNQEYPERVKWFQNILNNLED